MDLKQQVLMAARDNGINSILFRNAMARKLGMNITDSACLSLLGITGISTPTEIAKHTGLTSGSTTALLDRLERKGFIKRKANPKDRRGVIVEIDKKYAERASKLVVGIQKSHRELIESYTEKELKLIVDFLTRFTNNVIEHTKTMDKDTM
jgi:DNA-binding MarR family transcriptional regulator